MEHIAGWPPGLVYVFLAVGTVIENILPPAPADIPVALAAFLVHRGGLESPGVFLSAWVGSVGGALFVHRLARRWGKRFLSTRVGRLVIQPDAFALMERGYLRFGMTGIFFMRLLPGFRMVVAPFTGLVPLSTWRSILPIALASGLWYGLLTIIGNRVGASWEEIRSILAELNVTLAVVAGIVGLGLVVVAFLARRRRRRERLWQAFHRAFEGDPAAEARSHEDPAYAACAVLLLELARSDVELDPTDHLSLVEYLRERLNLPAETSWQRSVVPIDPIEFARLLGLQYPLPDRVTLLQRLTHLGELAPPGHRQRLLQRAARLLGLSDPDGKVDAVSGAG